MQPFTHPQRTSVATATMGDLPIPPVIFTLLPYLAVCLALFAFVAITLPLAKKPIAGTTLRRQSIIAIIAAAIALFENKLQTWEVITITLIGAAFITLYYRNHLARKQNAEAIAAAKAATREAQLASFLAESDKQ